jgi:hypothetical protein
VLPTGSFLALEDNVIEDVGISASNNALTKAVVQKLRNSVAIGHLSHWHPVNGVGGSAADRGKAAEIQPPAFSRGQEREMQKRIGGGGEKRTRAARTVQQRQGSSSHWSRQQGDELGSLREAHPAPQGKHAEEVQERGVGVACSVTSCSESTHTTTGD